MEMKIHVKIRRSSDCPAKGANAEALYRPASPRLETVRSKPGRATHGHGPWPWILYIDTFGYSVTLPKAVLQDTCIAVVQVFAQQLQYFFNTYVPWYVQYC